MAEPPPRREEGLVAIEAPMMPCNSCRTQRIKCDGNAKACTRPGVGANAVLEQLFTKQGVSVDGTDTTLSVSPSFHLNSTPGMFLFETKRTWLTC